MEHVSEIRTVFCIQILNSFTSGILGIALPLMMDARHIDLIMMGLVFAAMPLIMQLGRMFFATVSDFWGRKLFFVSNGFMGITSGLIYYVAQTPLGFLFGKVTEGTKEGMLWAVNRAFLLEEGGGHWRILVHLRTVVYVAYAVGSLLAGFLVVWLLFEGTMLLCTVLAVLVIILSLTLAGKRRKQISMRKALRFLDFRRKERIFKVFFVLFFVMGVSFGFIGGFVLTMFLDREGFNAEAIGIIFGAQILLAGMFSYIFARTTKMRRLVLLSGFLFSATFFLLVFSSALSAVALLIFWGAVEGITSIGQEGILTKISNRESYGTDIGLTWMGFHVGESASIALAGLLIEVWGFAAPFLITASTYLAFSIGSYLILKK